MPLSWCGVSSGSPGSILGMYGSEEYSPIGESSPAEVAVVAITVPPDVALEGAELLPNCPPE